MIACVPNLFKQNDDCMSKRINFWLLKSTQSLWVMDRKIQPGEKSLVQ